MNSNERRLKILYMLQSGKKITTRTLTEQFSISKRTVFRDLRVIEKLGVPVTHYPDSGYGVMRDGLIPPMMFTFRELSVIMMGLSFVSSQVDQEMSADAENVSLKISNAVPPALRTQMDVLKKRTLVSPYIQNVEDRDYGGDWFTLCSAFVENKAVTFFYRDRNGKVSKRTIDPKLLVHYTDHWNIIGYCHDRKALRNFVLSRIRDITISDSATRNTQEYQREDLLYGRQDNPVTVTVTIPLEKSFTFLTELPGRVLSKKKSNRKLEVAFSIDNLDFINEWLLRFGTSVKILTPEKLKQKRSLLLHSMLEKA